MAMSLARQQEIALKVMIARVAEGNGIPCKRKLNEDLASASKAIGIPVKEMRELYIELMPHILASILGVKKVTVVIEES